MPGGQHQPDAARVADEPGERRHQRRQHPQHHQRQAEDAQGRHQEKQRILERVLRQLRADHRHDHAALPAQEIGSIGGRDQQQHIEIGALPPGPAHHPGLFLLVGDDRVPRIGERRRHLGQQGDPQQDDAQAQPAGRQIDAQVGLRAEIEEAARVPHHPCNPFAQQEPEDQRHRAQEHPFAEGDADHLADGRAAAAKDRGLVALALGGQPGYQADEHQHQAQDRHAERVKHHGEPRSGLLVLFERLHRRDAELQVGEQADGSLLCAQNIGYQAV